MANMTFMKIFSPLFRNGKLITFDWTFIATAYPLHTVENANLSSFVSTKSYKSIKDIEDMRNPTKVNMKLKFINTAEPRQLEYCLPNICKCFRPKR